MLYTYFAGQQLLVVITLVLCLAVAVVTYLVGRRRLRQPVASALFASSVVGALCLVFSGSSGNALRTCVINRQITEAFLNDQGLLNVALFVPLGFFGLLATRRPLAIVLGAPALSATIEVSQALIPPIARNCDSSDFVANTIGAWLGVVLAWIAVRIRKSAPGEFRRDARPIAWTAGSVLCLNAVASAVWITPNFMDSSTVQYATSEMKDAARRHVSQAFGDHYRIGKVSYDPTSRALYIGLDGGMAHLSWPDQKEFNVSLVSYQKGIKPGDVGSFPVASAVGAPTNETEARKIAVEYATSHYPKAVEGAKIDSYDIADGRLGWGISWRRTVDGVLMPMRLDLAIDRKGQVSDLLIRDIPDPRHLPKPRLNEKQAKELAQKDPNLPESVTRIGKGTLLARSDTGEDPKVVWLFPTGIGEEEGPVVAVDAVTGRPVDNAQELSPQRQSEDTGVTTSTEGH
ncbi:VanZ family protein [Streptomyces sp. NPDC003077]|uniref:VanZ family protein n=1 Tax=Streptomyces sp. NPDC003077 TaxID=3154443 RepID=UPI0033A233ED